MKLKNGYKEHKNNPVVPLVSYSLATLVGLSRLTENKHWPTDILVGAVLGFLSGKQVVNQYHRFSKLRAHNQKSKNPVSFHMQYSFGQLLPGFTYHL